MNIYFFRRPKPKQFNYKPMYYDPVKEEMEERKKAMGYTEGDDPRERFRSNVRRHWRKEEPVKDRYSQFLRVFFYVIFAVFVIYFIFFTDFINRMVSFFMR